MTQTRFELSSSYSPPENGGKPRYVLRLLNRSGATLRDFRLGFSGPGRIASGATLAGAELVEQLSNWCEIAPSPGFSLPDGQIWEIVVRDLPPMHHWTDGATAAAVIHEDGGAEPVAVVPTQSTASNLPLRRGVPALPVPIPAPAPLAIVPWPLRVATTGSRTPPEGLAPIGEQAEARRAIAGFERLSGALFPGEGLVRPPEQGGYPVTLLPDGDQPLEGYRLRFAPDRVEVRAAGATGYLYGLITLGQVARGARYHPRSYLFPTGGEIEDRPEFGWRGSHLDVARRFYGEGEVAQFLRILAWNKLNRLHLHLSDDEGWRVEIAAFPALTGVGAWQAHGATLPPLLGGSAEASGGFYSRAAIARLVALGLELGVEIVPEIDVPGHCFALLQALPHLADPDETGTYNSIQSFPNNCLNPGVDAVYGTLETIFGELTELFPARWFHVGADEVPADAWRGSPAAGALLRQLGGTGAPALQAHFLRRVKTMLAGAGKVTGAWEEGALGGGIDKAGSYMVGWHTVAASRRLASEGYDVVVAPGQHYYFDMANGPGWDEPGASWAGWSSPEATYAFDPAAGWSDPERAHLLGVQACIWGEPMRDRGVFDRLVFPRLSAVAESGWSTPRNRDFARFIAAAALMPSLYGTREAGP